MGTFFITGTVTAHVDRDRTGSGPATRHQVLSPA